MSYPIYVYKLILFSLFMLYVPYVGAVPGFLSADDSRLPPAVQDSAKRVLQISLFSKHALDVHNSWSGDLRGLERLRNFFPDFYFREVSRCVLQQSSQPCHLSKLLATGSAFPVLDKRHIMTATHALAFDSETVHYISHHSKEVVIVLSDHTGKVIYDGRRPGHYAKIQYLRDSKVKDLSDIALLQLTDDIEIEPLEISDQDVTKDETMYSAGYPTRTTDRSQISGAQDSPGGELRVSYGKPIPFDYFYDSHLDNENKSQIDANDLVIFENEVLVTDGDVDLGMSGGPSFNSEGQVSSVIIWRGTGHGFWRHPLALKFSLIEIQKAATLPIEQIEETGLEGFIRALFGD